MNTFGIFSFLAGVLQLTIPSYAFRLIRRFGAQRVGWYLVSAFAFLALLHLLEPLKLVTGSALSGPTPDIIYAVCSVLLLIGMAHVETLISERLSATREGEKLLITWQAQADRKKETLAQTNEKLTQQIACLEKKQRVLAEAEAQYRFLFTENPQPMWIFDLSSHRCLAVNSAALRQQGFTEEEFMALGLQGLVSSDSAAGFLHNMSQPCARIGFRGRWPFRKQDGEIMEGELTAVDVKYGEQPARLGLVNDVGARRNRESELMEEQRTRTIGNVAGGGARSFNKT